jgi:hypothetical protein
MQSTGLSDWERAKKNSGLTLTKLWGLAKEKRLVLVYLDGALAPLTVTFQTAKKISNLGLTKLWELAKEKRLVLVYVDGRTLIWFPSLLRLLTPADIPTEFSRRESELANPEEIRQLPVANGLTAEALPPKRRRGRPRKLPPPNTSG